MSNWFHTIFKSKIEQVLHHLLKQMAQTLHHFWKQMQKNSMGMDVSVVVIEFVVMEEDMAAITLHTVLVILEILQVLRRTMVWANKKKGEAQTPRISFPQEVRISAIGVVWKDIGLVLVARQNTWLIFTKHHKRKRRKCRDKVCTHQWPNGVHKRDCYWLLEKICNNTQKFYVRRKHGI